MSMGLISDHPNVFCSEDKMIEGVVHKTLYKRGIRTYALHTVHEPPFDYALHTVHEPPFHHALHTVHATALNLGRPLDYIYRL
jgi:hypothetical protein